MSQKSFEDVIGRIKNLSADEKVAVAKFLAAQQGVLMYTEQEVVKIVAMAVVEAVNKDRDRQKMPMVLVP